MGVKPGGSESCDLYVNARTWGGGRALDRMARGPCALSVSKHLFLTHSFLL